MKINVLNILSIYKSYINLGIIENEGFLIEIKIFELISYEIHDIEQ